MTQNHPVSDTELDDASKAIREQREEIREDLEAEGVGLSEGVAGDPDAAGERADSG